MLSFQSGDSYYAISGDAVIEVVPSVKLFVLPTAPSQVVGLLNYGGGPLPVIDFSILMESRPSREALHTRIIILQGEVDEKPFMIGLRAEKVTEVFDGNLEDFQDKGITNNKWPFLDGVMAKSNQVIQRIDAEKLFEWYSNVVQKGIESAMENIELWSH
jgi:chemotaxis signal transduction protein